MDQLEQKKAAQAFVERWRAAEGNEQRESNKFWIELCQEVLDIPNATHVLDFERKVQGRRIDVLHEDMGILIENKSRGVDLDKAYERGKGEGGEARMVTPYAQAKWYADNMPRSQSPRWIITCNFDEIRIYDLNEESPQDDFETILLDELPDLVHRFSFFTRKEGSRAEREKALSVAAGEVVGRLYDQLSQRYNDIENDKNEQRSLNILITRIVFLLYAEDSGLLQEHQAFFSYLRGFKAEHMAGALRDLFKVLKTPDGKNGLPDERKALYLSDELAAFPYVTGGLFEADLAIPQFDEDLRFTLWQEASAEFDWKDISPTICGATFESTVNPETRRSG
ncbi:MAG: class I SAM-dependent DNA methyltransferase, partial [Eggerthellaceae bacterium]|nr:class I SAM-dependent DNA methyltransferase [Eggerthellaceae bacterium]